MVAISLASVVIPLFLIVLPFLVFQYYIDSHPVPRTNPHAQACIQSLGNVTSASFCLLPFRAYLPSCDGQSVVHHDIALDDLVIAQRVFHDLLIRLAPIPRYFQTVNAIGHAADLAMFHNDIMISDIQLLTDISQTARTTAYAMYAVLAHLELGLTR